jgi:hypothetical protein
MSSVVYVGRGSFRMEAIALEPEPVQEPGVVQPVSGVVTAPLHATDARRRDEDRQGPELRPLFGSQVDVPVLAAPMGSAPLGAVSLRAPVVTLSRAMLATLGGLVLLCGIVVGTAARHLLTSPAPLAVVAAPAVLAPVTALPVGPLTIAPAADTAPPQPPPLIAVPAPLTIHAHAKPVAESPTAPHARAMRPKAQTKPWVDPWAE